MVRKNLEEIEDNFEKDNFIHLKLWLTRHHPKIFKEYKEDVKLTNEVIFT